MSGSRRSGRMTGASLLVVAVLVSFLVPIAVQAAPAGTYSASSSATLLNLQLFAVPGAPKLTIGQGTSELTSSPLSAKGSGVGVDCPGTTECATKSSQTASAPPDSDPAPTSALTSLPPPLDQIVTLSSASGDAAAGTASGDPVGIGTGGVSELATSLNIGSLNPESATLIEEIAKQVASLIGLVPDTSVEQVDNIKKALGSILSNQVTKRPVLAVNLGSATAKSLTEGSKVTGRAETVGFQIGLLAICPLNADLQEDCTNTPLATLSPLTNGLLKINVTAGFAEAGWNGSDHSLDGAAASATIEVRDLTKAGMEYVKVAQNIVGQTVEVPLLPSQFGTTIKAATVDKDEANHTVTVNALEIHALKGLTDPSASSVQQQSNSQGGILLQVGNLKASATGAGPTSVLGLPKTGGMRYVFYTVAALLIVGAPVAYIVSRRLRKTTT